MKSDEIRQRFLNFFEKRGHAVIESASLVTSDEKGVTNPTLFNTAGMQPLIPYLLGKPHPKGKRLVDVQKCLRTVDIDDVGDKTHDTFFEMLGNWSLGDYFKKEAINWSYEFLTSKEEGLGLDPNRLYVTVFEGDSNASRDDEAAQIWKEIFAKNNIQGERIFYMPADKNWWEAGDNGPCGPDSEMYYDILGKFGGKGLTRKEFVAADDIRDVVEVWNDVFMQYEKKDGEIVGRLPSPSVDTGAGLERLAMTIQGVDNIYDTDLFQPIMEVINANSKSDNVRAKRIIADHIRAATFLIADGVAPFNTGRGYILRRLIRRSVAYGKRINLLNEAYSKIVGAVAEKYKKTNYDFNNLNLIAEELNKEINNFEQTLGLGMKKFETVIKLNPKQISSEDAFMLFSSYGLPIDMIIDLAKEKEVSVDILGFNEKFKNHQDLSRFGAEKKFKGGLADSNDPIIVKYHTATHLLHRALKDVLGGDVSQKGSNITTERLRFDFSYAKKMSDEEKKKVEDLVNSKIQESLPVNKVLMAKEEAIKTGALHFFESKYEDQVSIYYIGNSLDGAYSKEFCGGPHVSNTGELGNFKILKEEAVSLGVRRIKAVLN